MRQCINGYITALMVGGDEAQSSEAEQDRERERDSALILL